MPKVSVVITCYNYGKYLIESIQSALDQTFSCFEIIVIDDGSTDNTRSLMSKYVSDSRVRYIYQENLGRPKAKNRGIAESKGEFVAFLDADDIWALDKIERQIELFTDPDIGVVYCRRNWIDPEGRVITGNERRLRRGNILDFIFVDNFICFSSSIVRKHLLTAVGGFDENLPMGIDYDLWTRLAARCQFDYVDERLVKYRTGHANLSKNVSRRYACAQQIMNKALSNPEIVEKLSWWVPRLAWADTWSNMGRDYVVQGNYKDGIHFFLKALKKLPISLRVWKRLAASIVHASSS